MDAQQFKALFKECIKLGEIKISAYIKSSENMGNEVVTTIVIDDTLIHEEVESADIIGLNKF